MTATVVAVCVVVVELMAISWVQWRYMDTPPLSAAAKVMIGGALVFALRPFLAGGFQPSFEGPF